MAKKNTSALNKNKGVSKTEISKANSFSKIYKKRKSEIDCKALITAILKKDITALSRAITLIESKNPKHAKKANAIIDACLPHANKSIRIGITGVPGVGKSTFIEAFGTHLTALGKRVAVLAIDPSSTLNKGSILGDKTRMEALAKDKNAFIRPSASGNSLGGVAKTTRETIILCEAAGFDIIIIETVGVGQSETTVHSMVDFFLLLKLAGAGDELQGIKRGIIEMADAIVMNKGDGNNLEPAKIAKAEFSRALHLYSEKTSGWLPKVSICSALKNDGIKDIWNMVLDYVSITSQNGYFNKRRNQQNEYWLIQTIETHLNSNFFNNKKIQSELAKQLQLIKKNKTSPFSAAKYLLKIKTDSV